MQHPSTPDQEPQARAGGQAVLELIERSEALPASVTAAVAFESVMGPLIQRLPAVPAMDFVDRRLPSDLRDLLLRDAEEALEDGVESELSDYLDEVAGQLELSAEQARELVDVVVGSLRLLMSAEEVDAIANELSPQLASMWLRASDVPGAPRHSGTP